jgi:2-polyprenyl-3-methyl-5-hydroxy-6-metoxy-1,4-benzoquinol methylase
MSHRSSVLDIGCGIGNFVAHAQSVGLRAVGSDLDPNAIRTARERGLTAYSGSELDEHLPPGSVDAVSMWDVIEHLFNPLTVLRGAVDKLRPGGALLIETPDAAFPVRPALLAAHRLSSGRINLTAPMYYWEHKIYFTERGLTALLDRVGVEVVSVQRATSLREKMEADFSETNDGTPMHRFLDAAWPTLETIFRGLGRGNKLLVVGRRSKT